MNDLHKQNGKYERGDITSELRGI